MRHGVGTTLVRGAVTLARGLGFESLWCGVVEANRGAVHFLHAAGFRKVRRERAAIGAKRDVAVVILARPVSAAG
jgi:ribosomal protein S18 acetylase RimI-like enzyme